MKLKELLTNKKIILAVALLVIGIPLTVFLARQQQETRSRADEANLVQFELSPSQLTKNPGQTFQVGVFIKAGSNVISALDTSLTIDKNLVDFVSFNSSARFDKIIRQSYSADTGILRLTAVNRRKINLSGSVRIGTLTFRAKSPGTALVNFASSPKVVALSKPGFLQVGSSINGSYAIAAAPTSVPSPTPSPVSPTPSPSVSPSPIVAPNYNGYFDVLNCSYFTGWAADRNNLNTTLTVDVYIDGNKFTNITADKPRPDIAPYLGSNNTNHGFTSPTFATLKDGNAHTVRIQYGGTGLGLGTNNKTITCAP